MVEVKKGPKINEAMVGLGEEARYSMNGCVVVVLVLVLVESGGSSFL